MGQSLWLLHDTPVRSWPGHRKPLDMHLCLSTSLTLGHLPFDVLRKCKRKAGVISSKRKSLVLIGT